MGQLFAINSSIFLIVVMMTSWIIYFKGSLIFNVLIPKLKLKTVCSPNLVYVGFLDLGLLGAGAGGAGEVPVALHHALSLEQARDTEHRPK